MTARPNRTPDWQSSLALYLSATARLTFAFGRWDCALFVAGAVAAQGGPNLIPDWTYRTRAEGLRKMRAAGHDDHVAWFAAHLPAVPPAELQPGDVAILPGTTLGIVQGRYVYTVAPGGLSLSPLSAAIGGLAV